MSDAASIEASSFSVHVLKCPFGVRELHFTADDADATETSLGEHYAHVCGNRADSADAPQQRLSNYAVAGTRGIQQLVATTRSTQAERPNDANAAARQPASPPAAPAPDIFSTHDKGRLLLWDSNTGTLAAAHAFNPAFTVHQWVVAGPCIYTTLEGSPATAGAEEETCVYVWDRRTLQPVTVLRGHEGRLTALAVAPSPKSPSSTAAAASSSSTDVVLATASLDGTVRLWRHRSTGANGASAATANPLQTYAVLPTAELGVIKSLRFLSADVVVAACSKCALAFVRLTNAAMKSGGRTASPSGGAAVDAVGGLRWQVLRSSVDPDGSTSTLHVSPSFATDARKIFGNGGASSAAGKPASPVGDPRRRICIVTGSTSGYLQEWVVELGDGESQAGLSAPPPQPAAEAEKGAADGSPATTAAAAAAAAAGVSVRGRWHHKAHTATVDCILTDDDVAVSTSIFDGARVYHRRAGATCIVATTAAVPVLVPQLKQLIWGSVDGTLSVASYALFASGAQKELQPLWTAKPHTAAIRGVCLSLSAGLQWRVLCVGAADGSVSVWRPASPPAVSQPTAKLGKAANPSLSRVFDVYAAPTLPGAPRPALVMAGLKREGGGYVLAVATVGADAEATSGLATLPFVPPSAPADEITCARLCCGADTTGNKLVLLAGTRGGRLLLSTHDAASDTWGALEACKWSAGKAHQRVSIAAISPLRAASGGNALLAVVAHSGANLSLATQRVTVTVLRTRMEKVEVVVDEVAVFEGSVEVSAPSQGSLVSDLSGVNNNNNNSSVSGSSEPRVDVAWMVDESARAAPGSSASASAVGKGVVVRDTRGLLIRCRADGAATWSAPEVVIKPSTAPPGSFAGVTPNLDGALAEVVSADRSDSNVLCVHVASGRKRVLVKAATRLNEPMSFMCDVATAAVRFAGVIRGGVGSVVALYDDKGHEQYRVTRDGTCAAIGNATPRKEANFTPHSGTASRRSSPARSLSQASAPPTACTVLAASAADRVLFIGYDDGLLQMVDTSDLFVFARVWLKDDAGVGRGIRELHYAHGVVLARLSGGARRALVVPPRSILDQPLPL